MPDDFEEIARMEGRIARDTGKILDDCPYSYSGHERDTTRQDLQAHAWECGWEEKNEELKTTRQSYPVQNFSAFQL